MSTALATLEATAIEACTVGGAYLRDLYRSGETEAQLLEHDVKSSADTGSEERMLEVIRSRVPDHRIDAEESGVHEGDDYEWIVEYSPLVVDTRNATKNVKRHRERIVKA